MPVKTKTTSPKWSKDSIQEAYVRHILLKGKRPVSVFAFADELGMPETTFYTFYSSFETIENLVFEEMMKETLSTIRKDSEYLKFTAQEKLLTFYFAHLQILKERRSFVAVKWPELKKRATTPSWLKGYKSVFLTYARSIIGEGIQTDEIKDRTFLSERYDKAFWLQLIFVVDYWLKDSSADFEKTDAAVEKAVNLSFQVLGDSTLDSILDFAKFLWQSK